MAFVYRYKLEVLPRTAPSAEVADIIHSVASTTCGGKLQGEDKTLPDSQLLLLKLYCRKASSWSVYNNDR